MDQFSGEVPAFASPPPSDMDSINIDIANNNIIPPPANPNPPPPTTAPTNTTSSSALDRLVRVPDIDDDVFSHDNVFESSPYLDARKSKRNKSGFGAFDSLLQNRKPGRDRIAALICGGILILSVALVSMLSPKMKNPDYIALDKFGVYVPRVLEENFATWTQLDDDDDVPFFWDVPLSGGNILEDVLGSCLKLVQASDVGVTKVGFHTGDTLQIVEIYGDEYVNVDTTTLPGINRAINLNLAPSALADVIHSPYFLEAAPIFSQQHRGRLFALIRHPIQRAIHLFHYLSDAKWDGYYQPQLKDITLEAYAESNWVENNYMTRILVNKSGGALTREDVDLAKEILRRKCLVGLFDKMYESLFRFERYFGWRMGTEKRTCQQRLLEQGMTKYEFPNVPMGSDAWILLLRQNRYDMEVYNYALTLFDYQGTTMFAST